MSKLILFYLSNFLINQLMDECNCTYIKKIKKNKNTVLLHEKKKGFGTTGVVPTD